MNALKPSELILNPDGSIYHLHLRPEQIADTIITVGDPNRVAMISKHFDRILHKAEKREFVTHTGTLNNKELTVISTGIGPDNIDIVFNELDALANIDFENRSFKSTHKKLRFIRVGTSGSLQKSIKVDDFLVSHAAIGLDNLLHYYPGNTESQEKSLLSNFLDHLQQINCPIPQPYAYKAAHSLTQLFSNSKAKGITLTAPGFYGPQGRSLRLGTRLNQGFFEHIQSFAWNGLQITNFEMETSAILGLAHLLGHEAISLNAILANRPSGTFSNQPKKTVENLIEWTLTRLTQ